VFKKLLPYLLLFAPLVFPLGESIKKKLFLNQIAPSFPNGHNLLKIMISQLISAIYGVFLEEEHDF
jgi:hypothetical protein